MSKTRDDMEQAQSTIENINDASDKAARNQKAKPLPDRNKWVKQQAERSAAQFDKAKKDGGM